MKRVIVTTTVSDWGEVLDRYRAMEGWDLVVVGDRRTPDRQFLGRKGVEYLDCDEQERLYPEVSKWLGWNCIQRRNVGFLYAFGEMGADIVASVDDDNMPYPRWEFEMDLISGSHAVDKINVSSELCSEPLGWVTDGRFWHRGYPHELLDKRHVVSYSREWCKISVGAGLWDGDPDVDAVQRLVMPVEEIYYRRRDRSFVFNTKYSVFNSQNTVFSRDVLPFYACLPGVGRFDDIWGGFLLQSKVGNCVCYGGVTVRHNRQHHSVQKDLHDERFGYKWNHRFLLDDCDLTQSYVPERTRNFYNAYRKDYDRYTG